MSEAITHTEHGCRILVYATPRASKSKVVGPHDGRIKIQLSAPPVDGAANQELIRFVADLLSISRSSVSLTQGLSSKRKTLEITGVSSEDATVALGL